MTALPSLTAAVYARKSTEQTGVIDEQRSVARQIEHARAYAARKGWTVLEEHVYVDDEISGAEFANRAGFVRLMNALKPRSPFQMLVMSEESRLGRETIETAYALKQLLTAGVRVFFYLEDRERTLGSATDKILLSVTAFADELEREKARQRTHDALARKARAGHVTGGRVFGYDNVDVETADGRRSHVERRIIEAEASVVRRMFELAAAGYGKKAIARTLNEDLAPAPRAQQGRPAAWCPSSVNAVLQRELYRGVIVWNASRKRDAWGQKRQQPRDASEWIWIDAPHLRIVAEELWTAAQARLERRRAGYLANTSGRCYGRPAGVRYCLALPADRVCRLWLLHRHHGDSHDTTSARDASAARMCVLPQPRRPRLRQPLAAATRGDRRCRARRHPAGPARAGDRERGDRARG